MDFGFWFTSHYIYESGNAMYILVYSDQVVVFQQLRRAQKKPNPIEIKRTICWDVCFS